MAAASRRGLGRQRRVWRRPQLPARAAAGAGPQLTELQREWVGRGGPALPDDVLRCVGLVEAGRPGGGVSRVYILGTVHLAPESVAAAAALIDAVAPDAVCIELCEERVGALFDDDTPPELWWTPRVELGPLPEGADEATLRAGLRVAPGQPVAREDLEADARDLLSTGLFGRVVPQADPPVQHQWPLVLRDGSRAHPMGCVRFACDARPLAPVLSFRAEGADADVAKEAESAATAAGPEGGAATVSALLAARAVLVERTGLQWRFEGLEDGAVVAKAVPALEAAGDMPPTGLETTVREERAAEAPTARRALPPPKPTTMEERVSRANARLQRAAASKLGVRPGEELAEALQSAARAGAGRVWLVDRPMSATRRRQLAATDAASAVAVQSEMVKMDAAELKAEVDGLLRGEGGEDIDGSGSTEVVQTVILNERDRWMARKTLEVCAGQPTSPGFTVDAESSALRYEQAPAPPEEAPHTIVLVVGLAHVNGIAEAWAEAGTIECADLM